MGPDRSPAAAGTLALPVSAAIVVIATDGSVGGLLAMGFAPGAALGVVGGAGLVAAELIYRLVGRGPLPPAAR